MLPSAVFTGWRSDEVGRGKAQEAQRCERGRFMLNVLIILFAPNTNARILRPCEMYIPTEKAKA